MSGVNHCHFIGRLGKDPEMRATKGGKSVCSFSIAVQERKDSPTQWINIVAWEKLAEIMEQYLTKGSLVYIQGRLQIRQYEDKDGNSRQTTEIVANKMTMLGQADNSQNASQGSTSEFEDEEIPFD